MTDEKALQNLVNTDFDDMRPEFVSGVKTVRKKILSKMKAKKMHGKNLNGEMLYNLARSYVEAINNGAVPNIETAWTYLCQNECIKAVEESYHKFEKEFQDQIDILEP
jgi:Guanylate-binding protein, C-terminal domain